MKKIFNLSLMILLLSSSVSFAMCPISNTKTACSYGGSEKISQSQIVPVFYDKKKEPCCSNKQKESVMRQKIVPVSDMYDRTFGAFFNSFRF